MNPISFLTAGLGGRSRTLALGAILALAGSGIVVAPAQAGTLVGLDRAVSSAAPAEQETAPRQMAATRTTVRAADPGDTVTVDTADHDVNVVGVSWRGSAPKRLQVRYRDHGAWTAWQHIDTEGDGPDPDSAEAKHAAKAATASTDPITVIGSQAVQIRSADARANATAAMKVTAASTDVTAADRAVGSAAAATAEPTAAGGAAQAAPAAYTAQSAAVSTGTYNSGLKANIVTRKQWGADESKVRCKADTTSKFTMSHVHHTSGSNS